MKLVTITTETGTVQYQLVNGSALPAIKAGHLTFETRSGVQSIPAGAVLDFTIEAGRTGSKSDRIKAELEKAENNLGEIAASVYDEANGVASADDPSFLTALSEYADAYAAFAAQKAKADRFFERRAATLAKREAKAPKATPAAVPEPSPASFTPDAPVTTPTPKPRKAAKK